mmetsp:Transcript_71859/g.233564  ORF Transcript_71859/g.233564 Transcript_71859/m.233564 type:complete len:480 (+) Transcript_71859:54-1493(+)
MEPCCVTPLVHVLCHQKCCDWRLRRGCMRLWCVVWIVLLVITIMGWAPVLGNQNNKKALPEEQFPGGLDLWYGIQWWGRGDVLHPVVNSTTGLGQGPSPFFDPTKPTVIYCHGWQNGGVGSSGLERLTSHDGIHMADSWIDQGWNVGTFYWTQFADEPNVEVAEAKIWETCLEDRVCYPNHAMSWRGKDGKSHPWNGGLQKSAGQIFYDSVVASMATARPESGFKLRLVGHSLGGGMVMAAGFKLAAAADKGEIPAFLKPDRIAMLDPNWSPANEEAVFTRMYEISHFHNVTVEVTRASSFSAPARYGNQLKNLGNYTCAFSWVDPLYVDPIDIEWLTGPAGGLKHMAARTSYFLSIDRNNPNRPSGPSARTPNDVLKQVTISGQYWKQTKGMSTETVLDDEYEKLAWATSEPITGASIEEWSTGLILLNVAAWGLTAYWSFWGCYHGAVFAQALSRSTAKNAGEFSDDSTERSDEDDE